MTFARLTAIYHISPDVIWSGMPLAMIRAYIGNAEKIIAQRQINAALAANLPQFENANEMMNEWIESADFEEAKATKATPAMLKMMGIGVKHVAKSG